jgi:hypothetical protein
MKKTERRHRNIPARRPSEGPRPHIPEIHIDALTRALCNLPDFAEDLQFWIKDRAVRYCWMNRGCLLDYGMERMEQALGKSDYDLSPAHIADRFRSDDERVLRGHSVVNRVELFGRFDHTACWCLTNKVPLRDSAGRIAGTAGITSALKHEAAEQAWPTLGMGSNESLANAKSKRITKSRKTKPELSRKEAWHTIPRTFLYSYPFRVFGFSWFVWATGPIL